MAVSEQVTLEGHIVDSLILPTVMDEIVSFGGGFRFLEFDVGKNQDEPSFARLEVTCPTEPELAELLALIARHGAVVETTEDARLVAAQTGGVFPQEFYSTTNQQTYVRHLGGWVAVQKQEMDCGVRAVGEAAFECVPVINVREGDRIV